MLWKDTLKKAFSNARNGPIGVTSFTGKLKELPDHIVQYPGTTERSQRKQLVIGFDFGTAFTKVVIGEDRVRYAVPWKKNDYLLPGTFYLSESGVCNLDDNGGEQISNLKMRLLNKEFDDKSLAFVCAFNALVLRRVRSFLLKNFQSTYGSNFIDWVVNVGLPTDNYHDTELENVYKKLFIAAWCVSAEPGEIMLEDCEHALNADHQDEDPSAINPNQITTFPEFVAQVTGYVRSPLRNRDLHLLVDVGAGTVDSTVFNVHEEDDEDIYPVFDKAVKNLGTRFLVKNRLNGTNLSEDGDLGHFAPIPSNSQFSKMLGITNDDLEKIDTEFFRNLHMMVSEILRHTKQKRYPLSRTWDVGIPIFFCGGGAKCDFYKEAIDQTERLSGFKFIQKEFPIPNDLVADGLDTHEFDRLSVAFGLSYEPFDIGEIIKSDEIDDIDDDENINHIAAHCSRCNGTGGLHHPCDQCGGSGFIHN